MKRVMVIGCCGAGKSTFSRALHAITQLELIHLDQHYWQPDWVETEPEEWRGIVQGLADKPSWIIDGNYGGTMDIRIERADTVIYLDYPTWKCLGRVVKRVLRNWGNERPDMPKGCPERFDAEFLHYVANYNRTRRPGLIQKLNTVRQEKQVEILKNDYEVATFLESVERSLRNYSE